MECLQTVEISAREDGQKLVELKFQGVTIDRYTTHDISKPPKRRCGWITNVVALCSQPSAEVGINIYDINFRPDSVFDRLERKDAEIAQLKQELLPKYSEPYIGFDWAKDALERMSVCDPETFKTMYEGSWKTSECNCGSQTALHSRNCTINIPYLKASCALDQITSAVERAENNASHG